jgi:hypothetical protein
VDAPRIWIELDWGAVVAWVVIFLLLAAFWAAVGYGLWEVT